MVTKKMEEFRRNEPADGVEHGHASASLENQLSRNMKSIIISLFV
jgi:hypothetical protein